MKKIIMCTIVLLSVVQNNVFARDTSRVNTPTENLLESDQEDVSPLAGEPVNNAVPAEEPADHVVVPVANNAIDVRDEHAGIKMAIICMCMAGTVFAGVHYFLVRSST